jgi:hypothetical protein
MAPTKLELANQYSNGGQYLGSMGYRGAPCGCRLWETIPAASILNTDLSVRCRKWGAGYVIERALTKVFAEWEAPPMAIGVRALNTSPYIVLSFRAIRFRPAAENNGRGFTPFTR